MNTNKKIDRFYADPDLSDDAKLQEDEWHQLTPITSYIREIKNDIDVQFLSMRLIEDRKKLIDYTLLESLRDHFEDQFLWIESNNLIDFIWGQLNVGVCIIDKSFYLKALEVLLGKDIMESANGSQHAIRFYFSKRYRK